MLFLIGCSTKRVNFTSRSYHKLTSKYNVLYNGNVALDKGIAHSNENYQDNYFEILPIEPLKITEEFTVSTEKKADDAPKTDFDVAEEKAVKAVQKHSMNIYGEEKNSQIDEAYFLLGKARYYSQRFIPALEAFDYSLKNNSKGNLNNDIRVWKAKTQIQLQNEEQGIEVLNNLLKRNDLTKAQKEQTHTALAMAYQAQEKPTLVIEQLLQANATQENIDQHSRNWFVLGQYYHQTQKPDSAQWAFNQILKNNKSPKKYKIHAYLEQAKSLSDKGQTAELKEKLQKLAKDFLNKSYLDEIYYQLAHINFVEGNDSLALSYLTQSVKLPSAKPFQKILSYEKLGDYHFDKNQYVVAGYYYDSVRPFVENANTKHIKKLERKIKNLQEVVAYENTLTQNDSILRIAGMSETERKTFFENHIAQLKKKEELAANQKENAERAANTASVATKEPKNKSKNTATTFYFHNAQTVEFGKIEFQRIWGKRSLQDNWRLSDQKTSDVARTKVNDNPYAKSASNATVEDNEHQVKYYLKSLPQTSEDFQKIADENGRALYQLGLIYKEKLKNYDFAEQRLTRFLAEKPKENLILPAQYHLYKIYELQNNPKQHTLKQTIISTYPDSRYAQMLTENTINVSSTDSIMTPETHYEKVYCDFEYRRYQTVVEQSEQAVAQYVDEPIQAKFDLLRAYALYHTKGKESFVEVLEYVVANYPKTDEAIHAQEVLDRLNGVVREKTVDVKIKDVPQINLQNKQDKEEKVVPQPAMSTEDERRQKVLEMMKNTGPPPQEPNRKSDK